MDDEQQQIGMNVAALREGESLSQEALADAMRLCGHRWTQATVWSIEKGKRAIKLTEALDLADILGTDVASLVLSEPETAVKRAMREVHVAEGAMSQGLRAYDEAHRALVDAVQAARRLGAQGRDMNVAAVMAERTVETAVRDWFMIRSGAQRAASGGDTDGEH